jgi:hypothetical protein
VIVIAWNGRRAIPDGGALGGKAGQTEKGRGSPGLFPRLDAAALRTARAP